MSWNEKSKSEPMPRPKIDVNPATDLEPTVNSTHVDVVISRDGKGKSYKGVGNTTSEVVKDVIEKVLNDPYTREWISKD